MLLSATAADIQRHYGTIARERHRAPDGECCEAGAGGCCTAPTVPYSAEELAALPEGAYLALGTGHPVAAASPKPGETVLDLGSGAGVDVLLAARAVGPAGRVIGVDFTPAMVARARRNAEAAGFRSVEIHEAPIERLPLPDASVDLIVSNCVVNLSLDKDAVLREAHRVLRPGGRLVVSDTLRLFAGPPTAVTCDCAGGAMSACEWKRGLRKAGFADPEVELTRTNACCGTEDTGAALIRARKA